MAVSTPGGPGGFELSDETPVYVISVAAQLAGMHAQTLRQYDRLGLVSPGRAPGGGRRYSGRDIRMLREVQRLSQDHGINLAGVKRIMELEDEVARLRQQVAGLEIDLETALATLRAREGVPSPSPYLPAPTPPPRSTALVVWRPPSRSRPGRRS